MENICAFRVPSGALSSNHHAATNDHIQSYRPPKVLVGMSGLDVLGALASTGQLVGYVITVSSKLNEVRRKIRNTPKRLEEYDRQFKELVAIAKYIEKNPPIQTKELDLCLKAILAKTTTIREILSNFEQLSKGRQRWTIISGNLLQQLNECFGDVRNTMENLALLIASQNAHDQKEIKELILRSSGVPMTSAQAISTATPLLRSTENSHALAECEKRKAGSHSFKGLTIRDNVTVSLGNVSNPSSILPHMAGHFFIDFTASGNKFLHIGNAGSNSEGHIFDVGVVEKNEATMLGDYADLEHKFREISLQRGGHSHQMV
ncbi:hypothetical protein F4823DRAFT_551427 [Ustulina deusta]|nr:hypothetical protein F4823DRAFT_551427 [Ustulina deusta]